MIGAICLIILQVAGVTQTAKAAAGEFFVCDSFDKSPLTMASITDASGKLIGFTDNSGRYAPSDDTKWPLCVSFAGFEKTCINQPVDTLALNQLSFTLPEYVVETDKTGAYILCFVRQYCEFTTSEATETVVTETMQDFILPFRKDIKGFKKQSIGRELNYRMAEYSKNGVVTDSISDFMEMWGSLLMPVSIGINRFTLPETVQIGHSDSLRIFRDDLVSDISLTPSRLTISTDWLQNEPNHVYSPGAMKLLGASFDLSRQDTRAAYQTKEDSATYDLFDLMTYTVSMETLLKGKFFKRFFKSKDPIKCRMRVEIYPVDYTFITTPESKTIRKNKPDSTPFILPPGI